MNLHTHLMFLLYNYLSYYNLLPKQAPLVNVNKISHFRQVAASVEQLIQ